MIPFFVLLQNTHQASVKTKFNHSLNNTNEIVYVFKQIKYIK